MDEARAVSVSPRGPVRAVEVADVHHAFRRRDEPRDLLQAIATTRSLCRLNKNSDTTIAAIGTSER